MADFLMLADFLAPVNLKEIAEDTNYKNGQFGNTLTVYDTEFPDLSEADIVIAGCTERRGSHPGKNDPNLLNTVRKELYRQYFWHKELKIADIGNILPGATLQDSYASVRIIAGELAKAGKKLLLIGGSHDLTLGLYQGLAGNKNTRFQVTCADALFDFDMEELSRSSNFLMELLTGEPNYVNHYNHIAFQSYYVHPSMLETLDKLRFDCFRVGRVQEAIEEMEPVIRNTALFSFDLSAIAHAFAPAAASFPNGLTGSEACSLLRYAGMSENLQAAGIFGYNPLGQNPPVTERQIAQMVWYFIDGVSVSKKEPSFHRKDAFIEFMVKFGELETVFLQSKRTGRWWMQLPDKSMMPCSYNDYLQATKNDIPERWFRAQERNF